jgi:outer membrane protein assembly factor BamB
MAWAVRVAILAILGAGPDAVRSLNLGKKSTHKKQAPAALYYWSGKNGDERRTGTSPFAVPRNLSAGPSWSFHEEAPPELQRLGYGYGLLRTAPLIDDKSNIYLATVTYGNVYKFSPAGEKLWQYKAGDQVQIPDIPSIYDGRLFAATNTGDAFALDMETGSQVWRRTIGRGTAGDTWSMTAADGIVIAATSGTGDPSMNHQLVALHASDGSEAWHFDIDGLVYNVLEGIQDGRVVFSTGFGKVFCLDLQTGRVIWETAKPQGGDYAMSTGGAMLGSNGIVYVTWNEAPLGENGQPAPVSPIDPSNGMVGAYSFENGTRIWTADFPTFSANNAATVGPSGPGGKLAVVVGVGSNPSIPNGGDVTSGTGPAHPARVVALDAVTGAEFWSYTLPTWHGAAMGDDQRLDICLPDAFSNAAIGADGTVYFGFQNGNFYALRDDDGDGSISDSEVSTWFTGAAFQGSPGLAPGMVVATPCDGMHVWRE